MNDEPFELKIAQCQAVVSFSYDDKFVKTLIGVEDVDAAAKLAAVYMEVVGEGMKKDLSKTTYAKDRLATWVGLRRKKLDSHYMPGEPFDTVEARQHQQMTPASAANMLRLAVAVNHSMPASFATIITETESRFREALEEDPAILAELSVVPSISEDLKRARALSKELFDRARARGESGNFLPMESEKAQVDASRLLKQGKDVLSGSLRSVPELDLVGTRWKNDLVEVGLEPKGIVNWSIGGKRDQGNWKIEDGWLMIEIPHPDFKDFHLKAELKENRLNGETWWGDDTERHRVTFQKQQ